MALWEEAIAGNEMWWSEEELRGNKKSLDKLWTTRN
jgi:hypothetical protein